MLRGLGSSEEEEEEEKEQRRHTVGSQPELPGCADELTAVIRHIYCGGLNGVSYLMLRRPLQVFCAVRRESFTVTITTCTDEEF